MNKLYLVPVIGLSVLLVGCGQSANVSVPSSPSTEVKIVDKQVTAKGKATEAIEVKVVDVQATAKGKTVEAIEVKAVDVQVTAKGQTAEAIEVKIVDEQVTTKGQEEETEEVFTEEELSNYEAEKAEAAAAQEALVAEAAAAVDTLKTIATGSLVGVSGKKAQGGVTIEEKDGQVMITLDDSFSVSNGPDLYVTLTQEQPLSGKKVALDESKVKILDILSNVKGKKVYTLSKAEFDQYNYGVTIWCKQYNIVFGSTTLQ